MPKENIDFPRTKQDQFQSLYYVPGTLRAGCWAGLLFRRLACVVVGAGRLVVRLGGLVVRRVVVVRRGAWVRGGLKYTIIIVVEDGFLMVRGMKPVF